MSGAASDDHGVERDTLALDLEGAVRLLTGGARLGDEGLVGVPGQRLDETPGVRRADLLVGRDEDGHAVALDLGEAGDGIQGLDETGLHVEGAGTCGPIALDREGPAGEGAQGPHGVEVAKDEPRRRGRAPAPQEVGALAGADALGRLPEALLPQRGQQVGAAGRRLDVHRGRLALDEAAEVGNHGVGVVGGQHLATLDARVAGRIDQSHHRAPGRSSGATMSGSDSGCTLG